MSSLISSSSLPMSLPIQSIKISRKVAVIGAGAAGLIAARELRREGHEVVVFERNNKIGGIWMYDSNVESDPLSLDPSRTLIHTSLYNSLRTNLPREVMGYRDYPFVAKQGKHRDSRRFPGHEEVLRYLEDFVSDFRLSELIRFETEVVRVGLVEDGKWGVSCRRRKRDGIVDDGEDEVYDSVVVCNGHYTEPNVADIPGIDVWPGKQIHSHNYRVPDPFHNQVCIRKSQHFHLRQGGNREARAFSTWTVTLVDHAPRILLQPPASKVVVVIGSSASAYDISRDIAKVAKEVHVASRSITNGPPTKEFSYDNMWLHSMLESAHEDGSVVFQDGSSVVVDIILHCTGYKYHFPFLEVGDTVTVDENRVAPLYKHVFPPHLAPWLSFIGLPFKVAPFPLCELQSKWVAAVLSGRISLPSQEVMMLDVETFYSKLESAGVPKRYTHNAAEYQFEYCDWLAAECGFQPIEEWRKQMYRANQKNRVGRPETYRDEWEDQYLVLQAGEDFLTYTHPIGDKSDQ